MEIVFTAHRFSCVKGNQPLGSRVTGVQSCAASWQVCQACSAGRVSLQWDTWSRHVPGVGKGACVHACTILPVHISTVYGALGGPPGGQTGPEEDAQGGICRSDTGPGCSLRG